MFSINVERVAGLCERRGLLRFEDIRGRVFYVDSAKIFFPQYNIAVFMDAERKRVTYRQPQRQVVSTELILMDIANELKKRVGWT